MYISRESEKSLEYLLTCYPVVSVNGPRQCGKSTMIINCLKDYAYISLDDPNTLKTIQLDPLNYLKNIGDKVIIDEAQYYPEVFHIIKLLSDKNNKQGQFVITGSQNFLMMKEIQESLAGRVGIIRMLPLSFREISNHYKNNSYKKLITNGGYPRLYKTKIAPHLFFRDYLDTYIKRDVKYLLNIRNINDFEKFLTLIAHNCSNVLNYSMISKTLGININTVRSWISILASSYIIFLLNSYSSNNKTRMIKSPKIYFNDTGLLCYLLGIISEKDYELSNDKGKVFENFIISEKIKNYENTLNQPKFSFYRDTNNVEVNLIDETDHSNTSLIEIKSSAIYRDEYKKNIDKVAERIQQNKLSKKLIYCGNTIFKDNDISVTTPTTELLL